MMVNALIGAAAGLVAGLIFGSLINVISYYMYSPMMNAMGPGMLMPGAFLGMSTGTFLGAVLGGLVGLKKNK